MAFCQQCGRAQGSESERFCGACGAAFPVPSPAPEIPVTQIPATQPVAIPPAMPPMAAPMPTAVLPAPSGSSGSQRGPFTVLAAVVTVIALGVGGYFIYTGLTGNKGGSDSAQGAATSLVSALSNQDAVGMANMIDPGEVSGLSNMLNSIKGRASSGLGGSSGRITDVLQLQTSGVTFSTSPLADGVSDVQITGGTYSLTVDPSKLPSSLISSMGGSTSSLPPAQHYTGNITDVLDKANLTGHDLIAVQDGGRWYVSLYATIANWVYEARQADGGIPSGVKPDWSLYANPPAPIVASDPAGVITNLVKAANDKNLQELLQNLPQGEVRGLYPFVPVINAVSPSTSDGTTVTSSNVQATTSDQGGSVAATYTGGTFVSTGPNGSKTIAFANDCMTTTDSSGYSDGQKCIPNQIASTLGITGVTLILRKVNGGYQLDPVASYVNAIRAAVNHAGQIKQLLINYFQARLGGYTSSSSGFSSSDPSSYPTY